MANQDGRNKVYRDEMIAQAKEYLSLCEQTNKTPSINGLAKHIGVSQQTVHTWRKDNSKYKFNQYVEQIPRRYNLHCEAISPTKISMDDEDNFCREKWDWVLTNRWAA